MHTGRFKVFRALAITLPIWLVGASVAPEAVAQAQRQPPQNAADKQKIDELSDQIARMQAEIARLRKQVSDLEQENKKLKEQAPPADGADPNAPGTPAPATPPTPGSPSKDPKTPANAPKKDAFAPTPAEPLSSPESAMQMYKEDYRIKVGDLDHSNPAAKDRAIVEVGKWVRTAKKVRGRVEWTISIAAFEPDALKGGGTITFNVLNPEDLRPYSDVRVTQPLNPGQFKLIADKPEQKTWKLVGQFSAEPKVNKDFDVPGDLLFIGPFAQLSTTLQVQTIGPAGGTKVKN